MDNFKIDITAEGRSSLQKALEIAFAHNAPGKKVDSYQVLKLESTPYNSIPESLNGRTALVLRWIKEEKLKVDGPVNLPFKLDTEGATDFAFRWLAEQEYEREPDHDGSNGKGWRIWTGGWGHVGDDRYAVCAIMPEWAMYGK